MRRSESDRIANYEQTDYQKLLETVENYKGGILLLWWNKYRVPLERGSELWADYVLYLHRMYNPKTPIAKTTWVFRSAHWFMLEQLESYRSTKQQRIRALGAFSLEARLDTTHGESAALRFEGNYMLVPSFENELLNSLEAEQVLSLWTGPEFLKRLTKKQRAFFLRAKSFNFDWTKAIKAEKHESYAYFMKNKIIERFKAFLLTKEIYYAL